MGVISYDYDLVYWLAVSYVQQNMIDSSLKHLHDLNETNYEKKCPICD